MLNTYTSVAVIPVAVVKTKEELCRIADYALEFLPALELTMRTEFSYEALTILAKEYPQLPRAAATVLSPEQADKIVDLGAEIIISPGFQPILLEHCANKKYSYIPGVATPAEVDQCLAFGHKFLKFFPASIFGGISWLQAMHPVYSHANVKFMPLGGVKLENVKEYLKQPNVFSCGGSWLCPVSLLEKKDWKEMRRRFKEAYELLKEIL